jgi:hypothetical protein
MSAIHQLHPALSARLRPRPGFHRFSVPDIESETLKAEVLMPFEAGLNESIDEAEEQNLEWLEALGLADSNVRLNVGKAAFHHLGSLVYREEDELGLQLATNFITFLFLFDDMADSAQSTVGANVEVMRQTTQLLMQGVEGHWSSPGDADHIDVSPRLRRKIERLQNALADITARMKDFTIDGAAPDLTFYSEAMREYLEGNVAEARSRCEAREQFQADVRSYTDLRLAVSAVHPCLELGCITRRFQVSRQARNSWQFRAMRRACNLSVSYVNDIFSYRKEALAGETSNLLIVLAKSGGYANSQAVLDRSCQVCDDVLIDYFAAAETVAKEPGVDRYARLMESWMRGNLEWYLARNERYLASSSTDVPIIRPYPEVVFHAMAG